jgi:hypothetical protein
MVSCAKSNTPQRGGEGERRASARCHIFAASLL